jgi:hypothetical protein
MRTTFAASVIRLISQGWTTDTNHGRLKVYLYCFGPAKPGPDRWWRSGPPLSSLVLYNNRFVFQSRAFGADDVEVVIPAAVDQKSAALDD